MSKCSYSTSFKCFFWITGLLYLDLLYLEKLLGKIEEWKESGGWNKFESVHLSDCLLLGQLMGYVSKRRDVWYSGAVPCFSSYNGTSCMVIGDWVLPQGHMCIIHSHKKMGDAAVLDRIWGKNNAPLPSFVPNQFSQKSWLFVFPCLLLLFLLFLGAKSVL